MPNTGRFRASLLTMTALAAGLLAAAPAWAQGVDQQINAIQRQIQALQRELAQMKRNLAGRDAAAIWVSVDVDAVDVAFAPGTNAPATIKARPNPIIPTPIRVTFLARRLSAIGCQSSVRQRLFGATLKSHYGAR